MFHKLPTDEVALKGYETQLSAALDGYERILSKQKYLAGDVRLPLAFSLYAYG